MERTRVKSGHLLSVGYDTATRTLEIEFKNGAVYQYENVSPQKFHAFANADSLGEYLAKKIKPVHKVTKI
jgi:hypothetical protein